MYLPPTAQNIVSLALAAIWAVGMITLYFRMRAKQVAYLKRFPLVEGVPLYDGCWRESIRRGGAYHLAGNAE